MLTHRPATPDDLRPVVDLFQAFDIAMRGFVDTDDADVSADWESPGFDTAARTRVVEDAGTVIAYAVVDTHGVCDTVVDLARPDAMDVTDELLAWLETTAPEVQHYQVVGDEALGEVLRRRGWVPRRTFWRMRFDHGAELPEPVWPEGVTVRGIDVERDARTVHEIVQMAFADIGDHIHKTYEEWGSQLLHPDRLDPELYIVAEEGGELVGVCLGQDMKDYDYVRQLAVPRQHRGRGIAKALLHEQFRRSAARGLPYTALGVDAANEAGATQLYERAGMHVSEEFTRWHHSA